MTPPPPCSTIARAARWPTTNEAVRLTAITRSQDSSFISRNGSCVQAAAFETTTSSRPASSYASRTARSHSSTSESSARIVPAVAAGRLELPGDLVETLLDAVDEVHLRRALGREAQRGRASEAAPAARHEDDLARVTTVTIT